VTTLALLLGRLWASPLARKALLVILALGAVGIAYSVGKSRGASAMHAADVAHEQAALAAAEKAYREQERAHDKVIDQIRVDYAAREAAAKVVDTEAVRALDTGVRRVRIPIVRCSPDVPTAGPTTGRVDGPQDAELAPKAASDLERIAADCDEGLRQLGALQEWARAAAALRSGGKRE